ncbi:polymorphic toxin type 15 domain-containing protein [Agrobacterium sp. CG674]
MAASRVKEEEETHTPPVPNSRTEDNTSIKRSCRFVTICFDSKNYNKTEYDRQLSMQENGINAMTPTKWLANRTKFELPGQPAAQRRASLPFQK